METSENGRGNERGKVIAWQARTSTIRQEDLLEERMLTHEAEEAVRARDAMREWIRTSLTHGATVESGPLKAKMVERFPRCTCGRKQGRCEQSYSVLSVYV